MTSVDQLITQIDAKRAQVKRLEEEIADLQGSVSAIVTAALYAGPPLSLRQKEVMELLALDASNKEMSDRLQISVRTCKFHISNLLRRFGKQTRRDLAMIARLNEGK